MKRATYTITWGDGYTQSVSSKTEAIKIAADLMNNYNFVSITKK